LSTPVVALLRVPVALPLWEEIDKPWSRSPWRCAKENLRATKSNFRQLALMENGALENQRRGGRKQPDDRNGIRPGVT